MDRCAGSNSVTSDDAGGGAMIAAHLLALGHRRIGLVTSPRASCIPERRAALIAGLEGKAEVVWEVTTPASETISNEIRRMFNEINVTAVVCSHDLIAIGLLRALWEMNVSVPEDVSVIGFDDVQWSAVVSPGLTTIRQPFAGLAQKAVEVLLDRMDRPARRARRIVVGVDLVERETVADLGVKHRRALGQRRRSPQPRVWLQDGQGLLLDERCGMGADRAASAARAEGSASRR